jgi:flagellar biogenesis protein FliO
LVLPLLLLTALDVAQAQPADVSGEAPKAAAPSSPNGALKPPTNQATVARKATSAKTKGATPKVPPITKPDAKDEQSEADAPEVEDAADATEAIPGEKAAVAPPAEATPTTAPPAATGPRNWLAPPHAEPIAAAPTSGKTTLWVLLATLMAVGAAFWVQQKRRRKTVEAEIGKVQLNVLASSRIGPKAHAVAVEFGGRVLVLGVTDSTVSCLQSLTKEDVSRSVGVHIDSVPSDSHSPRSERSSAHPKAGSFRSYLDDNLEQSAHGDGAAADHLAELTVDRATVSARRRDDLVNVEGQAAGLAARLKRTFEG